jgi:hypothetical protein
MQQDAAIARPYEMGDLIGQNTLENCMFVTGLGPAA